MPQRLLLIILLCIANSSFGQEWRTEPITPIDHQYIESQHEAIDTIARRQLGRQLNGQLDNDIALLQQLLDQQTIRKDQTRELQAMGIILGELLKNQKGLLWIIYTDKLGRSRALQIAGINEFIFPATQISRRVEVGIKVDVANIYKQLENAVTEIRNQPRFFK